jgi:hypothetical protein
VRRPLANLVARRCSDWSLRGAVAAAAESFTECEARRFTCARRARRSHELRGVSWSARSARRATANKRGTSHELRRVSWSASVRPAAWAAEDARSQPLGRVARSARVTCESACRRPCRVAAAAESFTECESWSARNPPAPPPRPHAPSHELQRFMGIHGVRV